MFTIQVNTFAESFVILQLDHAEQANQLFKVANDSVFISLICPKEGYSLICQESWLKDKKLLFTKRAKMEAGWLGFSIVVLFLLPKPGSYQEF